MINCDVFGNIEFWFAIAFSFVVSFVIAVIVQDVWNLFWDLHTIADDDEEFDTLTLNDELPLVCGCRVFDIVHNHVGVFLALDEEYAIVVVSQGNNKLYVYHTNPEALIVEEDME